MWRNILEIGPRFQVFLSNFLLRMRRNGHKLLPVKFLTPNFKFPWAVVSYSNTNFGSASAKIYTCFARKTSFVMQNFRNLGNIGGGGEIFWGNSQKAHHCLISRVLSHRSCKLQIRSRFFAPGVCTKKGHYKKSQRLYFTYLWGISHPTKFNQNRHTSSGCRHNQSHQVW